MRGFGEITRLCDVARPDIGVVTAVGHSHTERVGGIDGVAVAKRELVQALPTSGTAVLNADDERVMAMAAHTGASVITYGRAGDVRVIDLVLDELARARFTIDTPWGSGLVELAMSGAHMAMNAAGAIAAAGALGVPLDAAVAGVSTASVSAMRMQVTTLPNGATMHQRRLQRQPDLDGCRARRTRRDAGDATGRRARADGRTRRSGRRTPRDRVVGGEGRHRADRSRHRPVRRRADRPIRSPTSAILVRATSCS